MELEKEEKIDEIIIGSNLFRKKLKKVTKIAVQKVDSSLPFLERLAKIWKKEHLMLDLCFKKICKKN